MKKSILAVAATLLAVGAQAGVITFDYGLPIVQSVTEINQTGSLSKFDGSLGTLTGASLNLFGAATFSFAGTNTAAQTQAARINASTDLAFTSDLAGLDALLAAGISLSATSGVQNYAVGETKTFGPLNDSFGYTVDMASLLGALTGPGSFGITCASLSGFAVVGGGGNIATSQATTAGCGYQIAYTFDDTPPPNRVPEPASLALVGLALAGVGFASRRRKAV